MEQTVKVTPVEGYDIAVCGGGIAGISAALAAAREGKKVLLADKNGFLGGNLTIGLPLLGFLDEHGDRCIAEHRFRTCRSNLNVAVLTLYYGVVVNIPLLVFANAWVVNLFKFTCVNFHNALPFGYSVKNLLVSIL